MKKLLWILIIPFLMTACDPNEIDPTKGTIQLNMLGSYGDDPFVLNNYYEYDSGMKISYATLLFYMSNIRLVNDVDEEITLSEINFVNFKDNHSVAGTTGEGILEVNIKSGNYKAIRFGVGVPADINATNPSDYSRESPLSRSEMFWSWRGSYIFSMVECNLDTLDNGGNPTNDMFLTYHSGADAMYQSVEIPIDFTVTATETQTLQLELDARKIFITDSVFDVKMNSESHTNTDDFDIATTIIENLANAITVDE